MRFHVQPRCVPPAVAARRIGMTESAFLQMLPALQRSGFPQPVPVIGHYDLLAIDAWLDQQAGLSTPNQPDAVDPSIDFEKILASIGTGPTREERRAKQIAQSADSEAHAAHRAQLMYYGADTTKMTPSERERQLAHHVAERARELSKTSLSRHELVALKHLVEVGGVVIGQGKLRGGGAVTVLRLTARRYVDIVEDTYFLTDEGREAAVALVER